MLQPSCHGPPGRYHLVGLGIHRVRRDRRYHRGLGQVHPNLHRRRDHLDPAAGIPCYPLGLGWVHRDHSVHRGHGLGIHQGPDSGRLSLPDVLGAAGASCRGSGEVHPGHSGLEAGPCLCYHRRDYCPDGAARGCGPYRCSRRRGCCPDADQSGADCLGEGRPQPSRVWAPTRPASPGLRVHKRRATVRVSPADQRLRLGLQQAALETAGLGSGPAQMGWKARASPRPGEPRQ